MIKVAPGLYTSEEGAKEFHKRFYESMKEWLKQQEDDNNETDNR